MSSQLQGVKETVSRLVNDVFRNGCGDEDLMVTIITFTENHKGSYITRHSFTNGEEAAEFVNSIILCRPPGMPDVGDAEGGDTPENTKAALAELLQLDADISTIAFVITDSPPHLADGYVTDEARHEVQLLEEKHGITNPDLFHILARLKEHFDDQLVLSVIKYDSDVDRDQSLYGAVAKLFNGVLITPEDVREEHLAGGLMVIIRMLVNALRLEPSVLSSDDELAIRAFSFYDLENIQIPSGETEEIAVPLVGSRDELLLQLVERATSIIGKGFAKRAIRIHCIGDQIETLLVVAKGLVRVIPKDEAITRATRLLEKIKGSMDEEHRKQFKLSIEDVQKSLASDAFEKEMMPSEEMMCAVSGITLTSIEDTVRSYEPDNNEQPPDPRELLSNITSLFLGHLAVLELPKKAGLVDFMDAWSAVIKRVSSDVISADDFLKMIGKGESVRGLTNRDQEYNFLQLAADPTDCFGTELVRLASGTQILDILTAFLAGAKPGLFSPNMFRGTISACLMTLLSTDDAPLSEYQVKVVEKLVHTIRTLMGGHPKQLTLEPESALSKMLFRLLRLDAAAAEPHVVREFLEEMAANRAQRFAKYNPKDFLKLIEKMVGYKHQEDVEVAFDEHPLLDSSTFSFDVPNAVNVVKESTFSELFQRSASSVILAVYGKALSLQEIWPTYSGDLPKLLLLQKRVERYTLTAVSDGVTKLDRKWVRNEAMDTDLSDEKLYGHLALQLLKTKYEDFVKRMATRRVDELMERRRKIASEIMRAPIEEFITNLRTVVKTDADLEYKLLCAAFRNFGSDLKPSEYDEKVEILVTGRAKNESGAYEVVFNRGNLHPHPDRKFKLSDSLETRLRSLREMHNWSLEHHYRQSNVPNHNGHSNEKPSAWAKKRSSKNKTFWEQ